MHLSTVVFPEPFGPDSAALHARLELERQGPHDLPGPEVSLQTVYDEHGVLSVPCRLHRLRQNFNAHAAFPARSRYRHDERGLGQRTIYGADPVRRADSLCERDRRPGVPKLRPRSVRARRSPRARLGARSLQRRRLRANGGIPPGLRPPSARTSFRGRKRCFERYFPPPPAHILVGGAGGGREAFALLERGYRVTAFEPSEALAASMAAAADGRHLVRLPRRVRDPAAYRASERRLGRGHRCARPIRRLASSAGEASLTSGRSQVASSRSRASAASRKGRSS